MFLLVTDIHFSDNGCLHWLKQQRHAPCRILRMRVNGVSIMFSFACSAIYVPIGFRYPFTRYWLSVLARTTAAFFLPHPENE
jgi:hypothetical protein